MRFCMYVCMYVCVRRYEVGISIACARFYGFKVCVEADCGSCFASERVIDGCCPKTCIFILCKAAGTGSTTTSAKQTGMSLDGLNRAFNEAL